MTGETICCALHAPEYDAEALVPIMYSPTTGVKVRIHLGCCEEDRASWSDVRARCTRVKISADYYAYCGVDNALLLDDRDLIRRSDGKCPYGTRPIEVVWVQP